MSKWPDVALSELALINPPAANRPPDDAQIAFVTMSDLYSELSRTVSVRHRAFGEVRSGHTHFERGDLLVARITPCFENGKIGVADIDTATGAGSTEFHVVRPNPGLLDSDYALHFLRQPAIRAQGRLRMTGSAGQRRVPAAFLTALRVPLPALEEQRRIARILDTAARPRMALERKIDSLHRLKRALFVNTFGHPAENPFGFKVGTVGDIVAAADYGTSEKARSEGALPVLRMGNLTVNGDLEISDLKYLDSSTAEQYLVRPGDVLFNRTNSPELVGKTAVYDLPQVMAYAGYLIRVRMAQTQSPEYLAGFLNSGYGKAVLRMMAKSIIGMANINAKELRKIRIPIPPLDLQKTYELRLVAVRAQQELARQSITGAEHLSAALSYRAFAGEL